MWRALGEESTRTPYRPKPFDELSPAAGLRSCGPHGMRPYGLMDAAFFVGRGGPDYIRPLRRAGRMRYARTAWDAAPDGLDVGGLGPSGL